MLISPTTRPFYPVGHMAHNIQEGMGDRTHLSRSNLLELDLSLCWFHDHRHLVLVWSHLTYTDQIKTVEGPLFHRKDIGTKKVIEKRIRHMNELR